MVKINKIYTRTGDDGSTGLVGGHRVPKDDLRVEAYGTVDEANSALGLALVHAPSPAPITAQLLSLQHDLFDLGADLATPLVPAESPNSRLRITPAQVDRLESLIDEYNTRLNPLTSFVLPGGSPLAAALHFARAVVRRAERLTVALRRAQPDQTSPETVRYLNRLSDLLFVLARVANDDGSSDTLWVPGANRKPHHSSS